MTLIDEAKYLFKNKILDEDGVFNRVYLNDAILDLLRNYYDVHLFSYLPINIPNNMDMGRYMLSTFGVAANQEFVDLGNVHIDPYVAMALKSVKPFIWELPEVHNRRQLLQYEIATKHGQNLDNSFSIPIHGIWGETGIFSIDMGPYKIGLKPDLNVLMYELLPFAHLLHSSVMGLVDIAHKFELTTRQKEVLKWASEGKSNFEVSQILNLSEHTIKKHLIGSREALGAKNTAHAISIAITNKLLAI